ncbi:MAG: hypothetical protein M0Q51_16815 [Bacteroidales bacterium]|nr:hypothetical protein [Bacteroidales bacterium]
MATIPDKKLEEIKKLYASGLSAKDLAERLEVSMDAVYYFFRKHGLPRRTMSQTNQLRFNRKPPTFTINNKLSENHEKLKLMGTMLYWSEGSQWAGEGIVDFANSNQAMIQIFLMFLRKVCGIDESKLRVYLYCYSNQNPKELIRHWSKLTNISINQFTKPYVRHDYKIEKQGKMAYGLIHIRYYDKKLLLLIKEWISEQCNNYLG